MTKPRLACTLTLILILTPDPCPLTPTPDPHRKPDPDQVMAQLHAEQRAQLRTALHERHCLIGVAAVGAQPVLQSRLRAPRTRRRMLPRLDVRGAEGGLWVSKLVSRLVSLCC